MMRSLRATSLAYYFFATLIPMVFFLMAALGVFAHHSDQLPLNPEIENAAADRDHPEAKETGEKAA